MSFNSIVKQTPKFIKKTIQNKMGRKMETLGQFVKSTLEENRKELEEIRKLQRVLDQLRESESPRIYKISVSSNL